MDDSKEGKISQKSKGVDPCTLVCTAKSSDFSGQFSPSKTDWAYTDNIVELSDNQKDLINEMSKEFQDEDGQNV